MAARTHVIAGRCTTTYDDGTSSDQPRLGADDGDGASDGPGTVRRGDVVVVCKPDDTVLVHDADGYQPVAWLTRADHVAVDDDGLRAWKDDAVLEVTVDERFGGGQYPTSPAGDPVADCPDCGDTLLRTAGAVTCPDCGSNYGLPADATLTGTTCADCGLPELAIVRGERFEVCLDPGCEPLDDAVADAFDREWACPDCGDDLRVIRQGALLLGCDAYPDCDWSTGFPRDPIAGECDCGLPLLEANGSPTCLDDDCPQRPATPDAA